MQELIARGLTLLIAGCAAPPPTNREQASSQN